MARAVLLDRRGVVQQASAPALAAYPALILSHPALLSYWRLDEAPGGLGVTVADSKGSVTGSVLSGADRLGAVGAIVSDPDRAWGAFSSNSIQMGNVYGFAGTAHFTIEAWVKIGTFDGSNRRAVVSNIDSLGGSSGWAMFGNFVNDNILIRRGSDVAFAAFSSSNWAHFVYTFDGATIRLYINGALVASAASSAALTPYTNFAIGDAPWAGNPSAVPTDEVAIYNAALDLATIQAHYNQGIALPATGFNDFSVNDLSDASKWGYDVGASASDFNITGGKFTTAAGGNKIAYWKPGLATPPFRASVEYGDGDLGGDWGLVLKNAANNGGLMIRNPSAFGAWTIFVWRDDGTFNVYLNPGVGYSAASGHLHRLEFEVVPRVNPGDWRWIFRYFEDGIQKDSFQTDGSGAVEYWPGPSGSFYPGMRTWGGFSTMDNLAAMPL